MSERWLPAHILPHPLAPARPSAVARLQPPPSPASSPASDIVHRSAPPVAVAVRRRRPCRRPCPRPRQRASPTPSVVVVLGTRRRPCHLRSAPLSSPEAEPNPCVAELQAPAQPSPQSLQPRQNLADPRPSPKLADPHVNPSPRIWGQRRQSARETEGRAFPEPRLDRPEPQSARIWSFRAQVWPT